MEVSFLAEDAFRGLDKILVKEDALTALNKQKDEKIPDLWKTPVIRRDILYDNHFIIVL